MRAWIADKAIDVIITTGGTGFTGRDVTPEAVEPLFEKRMDGFSTAFHMVSHAKIGSSTIQSRATAGVAGATFIFCLPGSPGACRDAWDEILVHQLDYRYPAVQFRRADAAARRDHAPRQGAGRDGLSAAAEAQIQCSDSLVARCLFLRHQRLAPAPGRSRDLASRAESAGSGRRTLWCPSG